VKGFGDGALRDGVGAAPVKFALTGNDAGVGFGILVRREIVRY